ncbi:glycoside hydrolase family 43 protein [Streptomyces sp. Qhu-G9]|uniref:glycoside hydrolase family 43 protein n=1 Tax=Streptomyces sp. Qhu-G9 TaxID=3452799 RepID=UPI0022AC51AD|nr:glycoside hydrolase family 43 protein [Streptomyces aurantiacus]WAU84258.1 glycoside hydrolase family 43 protein [Streptomyces aurantiacus]
MSRDDDLPETPGRRRVLKGALAAGALLAAPGMAQAHAAVPTGAPGGPAGARYANPLVRNRADPYIHRHTDGSYYFTATAPEYDRIILRRSRTIRGIATAPESVIWTKHASGPMGAHIWAPEIHRIDGKWYIYFASAPAEDIWAIRIWVLENSHRDPLKGTWVERGQLRTAWETFSLDATTFTHRGSRYLAWAQHEPGMDNNTAVWLSKMADPLTLTGPQVRLTTPEYDWERIGFRVNEGPSVIKRNGRLFMSYSASATDFNYCMGLLTADAGSDLMDPANWAKSPTPVFTSNDTTKQYGPGHNCFTVAEDGRTDVLVYHARQYKDIVGDPLNDPNRHTRVQRLGWKRDGTPDFGIPVADNPPKERA